MCQPPLLAAASSDELHDACSLPSSDGRVPEWYVMLATLSGVNVYVPPGGITPDFTGRWSNTIDCGLPVVFVQVTGWWMIDTSHSGRKPSAVIVTRCPKSKFGSSASAGALGAGGGDECVADAPSPPPQADASSATEMRIAAMRTLITSSPAAANRGSGRSARAAAGSRASSPGGLRPAARSRAAGRRR